MAKVPTVKCRKDVLTSIMDPLPRPPTPPKPEGRDPQLDSKIDDFRRKDPAHAGPELLRNTDSFKWRRRAARFSENTPSGGEKWRPRACPLLDEKEMIKIFVDTLKNPYFNRIVGLQLQFLVNLILVEERVEDAVKTKRMVDMPALMALVEQIAKRTLVEKNEEGV
uniref:Uncharacterized protein n=1 Tax=Fagus sylvatica TaxID=28930 RepID=A0A2N9I7M4_FAGSY